MVLETTLICLDNSEYSRNGDYIPSRLEAQRDAANLICGAKTSENPENAVGLLTAGGDRAVVRVTPTQDVGKILQSLHDIEPEGELDIVRALQTAQLSLKHRMHKNQRQRIVLFVGSPVAASEKQLELLGRTLKKNNVALDIISFGDTEKNSQKLARLHAAVNSSDTSHFVEYPVDSSRLLSDVLMTSPIIRGNAEATFGDEAGSGAGDIGANPNADPELYMALQLSLQEERDRQARAAAAAAEANAPATASGPVAATSASTAAAPAELPPADAVDAETLDGIDDELRQALMISLNDFQNAPPSASSFEQATADHASHELAGAGDMSIIPPEEAATPVGTASAKLASREQVAAITSEDAGPPRTASVTAMQQFLSSLPGVDTTNPALQEAVYQVMGGEATRTNDAKPPDDGMSDEDDKTMQDHTQKPDKEEDK